jgi:ABC-2 type transport system permease protein
MLKILIQLLGADYEQWLALTRVAIKLDLRTDSIARQQSSGTSSSTMQMVSRFLIYLVFGGFLGVWVGINKDVFFTGTILITYIMVMGAMLVLIDFGAVVMSPDDFAIIGYQPVSSRTYFLSRLTNVLIYSTTISLTLGIIPVGVFFFTLGFKPLLGFAALLAVLLGSICTTFFLVFIYAGLMRVIHPNKLRRAMGYVQMAMSFIFSGGYLLMMGSMQEKSISSMTLTPGPWFFLLPPAWFASYLKLAIGNGRLPEIGAALFSLAALVFLFIKARGKLALAYLDQLSSAMAVSEGPKKISKSTARRSRLFRDGEARVVALLVRNQFKYDQKFRLAVLGILPLSAVYLFMALQRGPLTDPFIIRGFGSGNSWLLYFAVLMFPIMLNASLANSDSYQASWIYYATPADRSRLILASKGFVFAYFVIPYLTFLGAIFLYFWGNLLHVVVHSGVLALLSYIFLQITVLLHPVLPFSMPLRKAERSTKLVGIMMLTPIAAIGLMGVLFYLAYPHPPVLAGAMIGLVLFSWLLEIALKNRAQRRTSSMEYQG